MNIIFFALYSLTAIMNIFSIQREKYIVRVVSKICLMPILLIFYFYKSDNPSFAITLALIFSWCGDIFLINPRKIKLYAGILSFLVAHILYVYTFICLVPEINTMTFIFSFLLVLSISIFLITKLHVPSKYRFLIIIYGTAISILIIFSLQVFIWHKNTDGFLFITGSVSFYISDMVLAYYNTVKTMTKKALVIVMLSYSIAQVCITSGFMNI